MPTRFSRLVAWLSLAERPGARGPVSASCFLELELLKGEKSEGICLHLTCLGASACAQHQARKSDGSAAAATRAQGEKISKQGTTDGEGRVSTA